MSTLSNQGTADADGRRFAFAATFVVLYISTCQLLIHLFGGRHYGYFVDELYCRV